MSNGLAWLNELMVWLGRWVPRLTLIKATHQGVLFAPRGQVRALEPGLWVWWPIIQDLELVSMRARTSELAAQLHGSEAVALVVGWSVVDAVQAVTRINEIAAYLDDATQAALARHVTPYIDRAALEQAILDDLRRQFIPLGISVDGVSVVQRGRVFSIKKLDDYAVHSNAALA